MSRLLSFCLLLALVTQIQAQTQTQLCSEKKVQQLRSLLPNIGDADLVAILADKNTIFYTDEEMPKAYQFRNTIHSPSYNISADPREQSKGPGRGGNGNIEFPWTTAGGTHRCDNLYVFRFLSLPEKGGKRQPIVWWTENLIGGDGSYRWVYPIGTTIGEVLVMHTPSGRGVAFEVRTRTRESNRWSVNVYRPFPTAAHLSTRIKTLRPEESNKGALGKLVAHLDNKHPRLHRLRLADRFHPTKVAFDKTTYVDTIPPMGNDKLTVELLTTTTFVSAEGEHWRSDAGEIAAPTTSSRFHIIPAKYDATFVGTESVSCAKCHDSVNKHVDTFDVGRDWYGRVRGSDGIFSFHPFDPNCISYNGIPRPVQMNQKLAATGVFARFNEKIHTVSYTNRGRE